MAKRKAGAPVSGDEAQSAREVFTSLFDRMAPSNWRQVISWVLADPCGVKIGRWHRKDGNVHLARGEEAMLMDQHKKIYYLSAVPLKTIVGAVRSLNIRLKQEKLPYQICYCYEEGGDPIKRARIRTSVFRLWVTKQEGGQQG